MNKRLFFYVTGCICLWALTPVLTKLGMRELDHLQFLFWSSLISFITCLNLFVLSGQFKAKYDYTIKDLAIIAGLGFLGTYLYYTLLYFGYANAVGIEVLVLQYCWPMFMIPLALFILRERLSLLRVLSVVAGFSGAILILTRGDFVLTADYRVHIVVLFAAFVFALFSILSKKILYPTTVLVTGYFLVATLCSFAAMMILSDFALPSLAILLPILINGILVNGVSYTLWLNALKLTEASYIVPFVFFIPVLSTIYLVLFFDEPLLWIYLIGLALVLLSGWLNAGHGLLAQRLKTGSE